MMNSLPISRRCLLKGAALGLATAIAPTAHSAWGQSREKFVDVVMVQPAYTGESSIRIGYMLKAWPYQKAGYSIKRIDILNADTGMTIQSFARDEDDWPRIFHDPLPENPVLAESGPLNAVYIPLQLRIPKSAAMPAKVAHRLTLQGSGPAADIKIIGGRFRPAYHQSVHVISSPVRGDTLVLFNQGTNGYHFNAVFFRNGKPNTGLVYAFDAIQTNEAHTSIMRDDGGKDILNNTDYCIYGAHIYAAASGTVIRIVDGFDDQQGHRKTQPITADSLAGNHIIIDIGNGYYSLYAHCQKGSFGHLKTGDQVTIGQPIATVGNSGNSDGPHLHFEIFSGSTDPLFSIGIPFVLDNFSVVGRIENCDLETMSLESTRLVKPRAYSKTMPDEISIIEVA